jgi:hypothetical protein
MNKVYGNITIKYMSYLYFPTQNKITTSNLYCKKNTKTIMNIMNCTQKLHMGGGGKKEN